MDETPKQAILPEYHRFESPSGPRKIADLQADEAGVTTLIAIRVDANWGVWIDPGASVLSNLHGNQPRSSHDNPVEILRTEGGFTVDLRYAAKHLNKKWVPSLLESYATQGFVPATHVI